MSGDQRLLGEELRHLSNAVKRDAAFVPAHAGLRWCARLSYAIDPATRWLEKADFHVCRRALANWIRIAEGTSQRFPIMAGRQEFHTEALAALKRALACRNNQPQAYNRRATSWNISGSCSTMLENVLKGQRTISSSKSVSLSIARVVGPRHDWRGTKFSLARAIQTASSGYLLSGAL